MTRHAAEKTSTVGEGSRDFFGGGYFVLAAASLSAIIATFFVAASDLNFAVKSIIFGAVVLSYPLLFAAVYFWQKNKTRGRNARREDARNELAETIFNEEVENRLRALEEASEFFGASLKQADMFRLCASRINEIVPFAACALFSASENDTHLKIILAAGENSERLKNLEIESDKGLAGKTFVSRRPQQDAELLLEKSAIIHAALENFTSAVGVPLARGAEVFGALVLYGNREKTFDEKSLRLAQAVAERVAPLFLSSLAFEQNVANALTDALTNLPNERAFYLVLENKIAESHRFGEERPLSILTVDIKNFTALNETFGHALGDRVLAFAAEIIKAQLRQMDFLARAGSDEFLAVLPTANKETAAEIVERIERAFAAKAFEISRQEKKYLQLNFGAATFFSDGETAGQLLQAAHLRKQQAKTPGKSSVLWFPKEYAN